MRHMAAVCFIDPLAVMQGIYVGWFAIWLAGVYHVDVLTVR